MDVQIKETKELAVFNVASQKPFLKDIARKILVMKRRTVTQKAIYGVRLLRLVKKMLFRGIYLKGKIKVF